MHGVSRKRNTGKTVRDTGRVERYSVADAIPPPRYDTYSAADTVGRAYANPPPRYDTYSTDDAIGPGSKTKSPNRDRNALLERIAPDYYPVDTERNIPTSGESPYCSSRAPPQSPKRDRYARNLNSISPETLLSESILRHHVSSTLTTVVRRGAAQTLPFPVAQ